MSINSCTINCESVDALCSDRRGQIIMTLQALLPQPSNDFFGGHHPQHVNPDTKINLNIFRRDNDREEVVEHTELPQISVTIFAGGETFVHTMDRGDEQFRPMINVYGVSLKDKVDESVNISDVKIRIL